ncbi:MAG: PSD1 domain-containing protein, partial [Planctomycetes bacterium]|nr:PSD1 domain-containing protein [Planctomycetota bacterium]
MGLNRWRRNWLGTATCWLAAATWFCVANVVVGQELKTPATVEPSAKDLEFFEREIVPLLQRHCYECHSHRTGKAKGGLVLDSRAGWEAGGLSGTAVIPGKPAESLLISAVRYDGLEMPPRGKLPDREIALLEKWVSLGAPDRREVTVAKTDSRQLWAWQPLQKPAVPAPRQADWPHETLDHFIVSRLEQQGLSPAPQADRATLIRRVTFDLTGLPPTPLEVDQFLQDDSDQAYTQLVDRLLSSPAFGDHWARHWFDLSCYADLADIDGNVLIRDAWRYRDYVIAAFNHDKPLDQFIHEQIAGDLLPYDSPEQHREQIIATGYLAIGPWTLQNYIKGQLDADVVDHQIDRIGRTFLGQTLSCARCHDHKFDPIPTKDYYALAGIFHSTRTTRYDGPGVWSQITHVPLPDLPGEVAAFERLARDISRQQDKLRAELQECQRRDAQERFAKKVISPHANSLTLSTGIPANTAGKRYRVTFAAGPSVWTDGSQSTGERDGLLLQVLRQDGSVLSHHVYRPAVWSGTNSAQQLSAAEFTYTGDGSGPITVHITASDFTGRFSGALDDLTIVERESATTVFAEDFDHCQLGGTKGQQPATGLTVYAGCVVAGWAGGGVNHSHAVNRGTTEKPNMALQIYSGPAVPPDNPRITKISEELTTLTQRLDAVRPGNSQALGVADVDTPHDSPIYRRGSFQSLGDVVPRGFLHAVPVSTQYEIPPQASGRLQLAQWLTDPANPLTARVLVNRIWQHVFGDGLVRSVDYFGIHGEKPSHPELLDHLAWQFRNVDRWSLKQTIRRMVLSRTYQMSSAHHPQAEVQDPDNRWLWRMPRRRLPAECIRDAMLAVSGQLDPGRSGPSLGLELNGNINGAGGTVNPATWGGQVAPYIRQRRAVYLPLPRQRPAGELEILGVFDFPHPSEIVGARPNTTVATQALFLMNSPFVKHHATKLAERLLRELPDDRSRLQRLSILTSSRPAELEEIETSLVFLDDCTRELMSAATAEAARLGAWT